MDRLTVPGTLDSLDAIAKYVMAAAAAAGLDRKPAYRLRLAVDEIATNVILHGYEEAGLAGEVALEADMDDHSLIIAMEDTALPYDPTATAPPGNMSRPLEEREAGGLGVWLALGGVDDFRYERVGDRNRSCFIVNRPGAVPGQN